jgi:hypothetical protein
LASSRTCDAVTDGVSRPTLQPPPPPQRSAAMVGWFFNKPVGRQYVAAFVGKCHRRRIIFYARTSANGWFPFVRKTSVPRANDVRAHGPEGKYLYDMQSQAIAKRYRFRGDCEDLVTDIYRDFTALTLSSWLRPPSRYASSRPLPHPIALSLFTDSHFYRTVWR